MELIFFVVVLIYSFVSASLLFTYNYLVPLYKLNIAKMKLDTREIPGIEEVINYIETTTPNFNDELHNKFKMYGIIGSVVTLILIVLSFVFCGLFGFLFLGEAALIYGFLYKKPLYTIWVGETVKRIVSSDTIDVYGHPLYGQQEWWPGFVEYFPEETKIMTELFEEERDIILVTLLLGVATLILVALIILIFVL